MIVLFTKLLPGWVEVPLNLLDETESVDLLLNAGKVEVVSDEALAAAKKIAKAANYLPLYLTILGGVIAQYEGDDAWQEDVLEELKRDRVGVISDEEMGDVAAVIDTSLCMVNRFTQAVLMSLATVPEDVSSVVFTKIYSCQ